MNPDYYSDLFKELLEGRKLTTAEIEDLVAWLGNEKLDTHVESLILSQLSRSVKDEEISKEIRNVLEARLPLILEQSRNKAEVHKIPVFKTRWFRYAAAIIVLVGISIFFFLVERSSPKKSHGLAVQKTEKSIDIPPGKEGAILTLSDGSTVVLDSLGNGIIATQNGTQIVLKNGQLVYNADGSANKEIAYNTISTPKGRQFQLVLPDGSKVWLNAASSLRYPIIFTGNERNVEITGEAYFEVSKNSKMPFRVKVNDQAAIEVLGTHFNINSYTNESDIKTTLLEGSVRIVNGDENVVIRPGQQAKINNGSQQVNTSQRTHITVVDAVNINKVMAWKNGVFDFQDANLEEVMRQLERWYDIEVVYEKGVPQLEFVGKMGRDLNLSDVVRGLALSKVHCRLEGRRLIVMP